MPNQYNTSLTLIQRAQDPNNEKAWNDFAEVYKGYIYVIISEMGIWEDDCQDLSQQVMIKVWQKLPDFDYNRDRSKFRTWLGALTRNTVVDFIRKQKSRIRMEEKVVQDETLNYLELITLPERDDYAEKEWKNYVANLALRNVKEFFSGKAIEVFQLSMKGVSKIEIAKKLDLHPESVTCLRGRVKRRLQDEIKHLRTEYE